jgi:hypothetical protein
MRFMTPLEADKDTEGLQAELIAGVRAHQAAKW